MTTEINPEYICKVCSDLKLKGCSSYNFKIKCKDKFTISSFLNIYISNDKTILPNVCA